MASFSVFKVTCAVYCAAEMFLHSASLNSTHYLEACKGLDQISFISKKSLNCKSLNWTTDCSVFGLPTQHRHATSSKTCVKGVK